MPEAAEDRKTSLSTSGHREKGPEDRPLSVLVEQAGLSVSGTNTAKAKTELQAALEGLGVTPQWLAERMKENAQSFRPISYLGKVTDWVPDTANRVKAAEQILRISGEYQQAEQASLALGFELSLDDRRRIQVKAAARLTSWGRAYQEATDEIGEDEYPT